VLEHQRRSAALPVDRHGIPEAGEAKNSEVRGRAIHSDLAKRHARGRAVKLAIDPSQYRPFLRIEPTCASWALENYCSSYFADSI